MDKYKGYLAANVLNEEKTVSYRQLSRALGVKVDTAKQMLYWFHNDTNAKGKNSVHATYTIIGKRPPMRYESANGAGYEEDVNMDDNLLQSSAPEVAMPEEDGIAVTAVVLAQEEDLDAALETFEVVETLSIYSIEPSRHQDIQVLSICNSELPKMTTDVNPLEAWKLYGSIHDPNCKFRKSSKSLPTTVAPIPTTSKPTATAPAKSSKPTPSATTTSAAPAKLSALAAKKKPNPMEFFKGNPKTAAPAAAADTKMKDAPRPEFDDEDDDDDDDFPVLPSKPSNRPDPRDKMQKLREDMERAEREEAAAEAEAEAKRKADAEAEAKVAEEAQDEDEEMVDAPEPPSASQGKQAAGAVGTEANVIVENGRRRGRRQVMKKRTVKDEEGYLVTREEKVWEDFSEDEPVPKKPRIDATSMQQKKGAGKTAPKGGIASFFKKKS